MGKHIFKLDKLIITFLKLMHVTFSGIYSIILLIAILLYKHKNILQLRNLQ